MLKIPKYQRKLQKSLKEYWWYCAIWEMRNKQKPSVVFGEQKHIQEIFHVSVLCQGWAFDIIPLLSRMKILFHLWKHIQQATKPESEFEKLVVTFSAFADPQANSENVPQVSPGLEWSYLLWTERRLLKSSERFRELNHLHWACASFNSFDEYEVGVSLSQRPLFKLRAKSSSQKGPLIKHRYHICTEQSVSVGNHNSLFFSRWENIKLLEMWTERREIRVTVMREFFCPKAERYFILRPIWSWIIFCWKPHKAKTT